MNFELVKLSKTASVLFVALAMAGCSGGSNNDTGMTDSTPPEPTVPEPTVPEPQAQAVMMDLELSRAQQLLLLLALPDAGTSDTVPIAAGATETRMGVVFTCDSAYPCTVTVTNSLDTINASWSSMMLPDGMAVVTAEIPRPPDPLLSPERMNPANRQRASPESSRRRGYHRRRRYGWKPLRQRCVHATNNSVGGVGLGRIRRLQHG